MSRRSPTPAATPRCNGASRTCAPAVHTCPSDAHLYSNHFEQAREQLAREPRALPRLRLDPDVRDIFGFRYEDIAIDGYDPWPAIKAPVAV